MRFQVPQFIEVEDKIFGPLTFKQFVYAGGGIGVAVVLFFLIPKFLAVLIGIPIVAFGFALAFYKMNGKPFINVVEAFVKYTFTNKLYLWKKEEKKPVAGERDRPLDQVYVPKLSDSKLKELTWGLGVKDDLNAENENRGDKI